MLSFCLKDRYVGNRTTPKWILLIAVDKEEDANADYSGLDEDLDYPVYRRLLQLSSNGPEFSRDIDGS